MSEDCTHGHNSQSEETYFFKETARLVADLRRMGEALQQAADKAMSAEVVAVSVKTRKVA